MESATAFAPATVANVAVGFDVLGFSFDVVGDRVTVTRTAEPGVRIVAAEGGDVPLEARHNTAGAALLALSEDLDLPFGFEVRLQKAIPLSSGMGGSAASAVGAVVAANRLLDRELPLARLLDHALAGESVASGAMHGDNVGPCLYGGLVALLPGRPMSVLELPVPAGLSCALVCPHARLDTRSQRRLLAASVPLEQHVEQSSWLAGFVAACHRGDLELLRRTMQDVIVGPQRMPGIPGAREAREAALQAGALGCSLAGSGPSMFAWTASEASAGSARSAMVQAFAAGGITADSWIGPVGGKGAEVVDGR